MKHGPPNHSNFTRQAVLLRYHKEATQQESFALLLSFPHRRKLDEPQDRLTAMIVIDGDIHLQRGAVPRRELANFLREAQQAIALSGRVTVLLTGDARIRELNYSFRGKNKATDVLSFPAAEAPGRVRLAGDLAISVDTAARQAGEHGHALDVEVRILALHGLLHLAGYDHERDTGQMAHKERTLRRRFALPHALTERAARGPKR